MKAKRTPQTIATTSPPVPSGLDALKHSGDSLHAAVQWMHAHLDEEPDPVKRKKLDTAITIGYFQAICAIYAPDWRPERSKERALVEEMARGVDWSQYPPANAG